MSIFKNGLAHPVVSLFTPKTNVLNTNDDKTKHIQESWTMAGHLNQELTFDYLLIFTIFTI